MHRICHFTYRSTTRYWYHPDHLGSASWVSDKAGKGIQHLYYLPWGEELDNQRATDYASRYTFSGKERDEETGYSYFGARYYNSDISIWLSVDPLADKYPSLSPYTYCADNPVKLVDPEGAFFRKFEDYEDGSFLGEIDDGVDETVCVTRQHYQALRNHYNNDLQKGDNSLSSYNDMIERYSIGEVGYDIAQCAKSYIGSELWAKNVKKDNFKIGSYKCNQFVYDVLAECNCTASYSNRAPLAVEWASPYVKIPNWGVVTGKVKVGDVIAGGFKYGDDATGHVAIVVDISDSGIIYTVSASSKVVRGENFGNCMINNGGKWCGHTYCPVSIRRFNF